VLVPLQAPPHVPVPLHAVRVPWGAPVTGEQVPVWPATSHAWHSPSQAMSQQTLSTQNVAPAVVQSLFCMHAEHTPPLQMPVSHSRHGADLQSPPAVRLHVPPSTFWGVHIPFDAQ
jgi:hypothetical protein